MDKSTHPSSYAEIPKPGNPERPGRKPETPAVPPSPKAPIVPHHPETPAVNPDIDPDIPEKPGPPLSDPEAPHGYRKWAASSGSPFVDILHDIDIGEQGADGKPID
jgi:hypothetical protein